MKNNSLKEIAEALKTGNSICLYPHENMDGDAFGSTVALAIALRSLGKDAFVYYTEELPDNLAFMDKGYVTTDDEKAKNADISMLVDCGEPARLGVRKDVFSYGKTSLCIDHHLTSEPSCDYNYVDPTEAATGQIAFELIKELGVEPNPEMGNALYAALITDTGNSQYSNTQKKSFFIAAELFDWGIDSAYVNMEIYESNRFQRMLIETYAMNNLIMSEDGILAMCHVTLEDLDRTGAQDSETENIVGRLRSIKGVEVAAFLREKRDGNISLSLRSKRYVDVSKIASQLGGGGHVRAAGATLKGITIEDAIIKVRETIEKNIHEVE